MSNTTLMILKRKAEFLNGLIACGTNPKLLKQFLQDKINNPDYLKSINEPSLFTLILILTDDYPEICEVILNNFISPEDIYEAFSTYIVYEKSGETSYRNGLDGIIWHSPSIALAVLKRALSNKEDGITAISKGIKNNHQSDSIYGRALHSVLFFQNRIVIEKLYALAPPSEILRIVGNNKDYFSIINYELNPQKHQHQYMSPEDQFAIEQLLFQYRVFLSPVTPNIYSHKNFKFNFHEFIQDPQNWDKYLEFLKREVEDSVAKGEVDFMLNLLQQIYKLLPSDDVSKKLEIELLIIKQTRLGNHADANQVEENLPNFTKDFPEIIQDTQKWKQYIEFLSHKAEESAAHDDFNSMLDLLQLLQQIYYLLPLDDVSKIGEIELLMTILSNLTQDFDENAWINKKEMQLAAVEDPKFPVDCLKLIEEIKTALEIFSESKQSRLQMLLHIATQRHQESLAEKRSQASKVDAKISVSEDKALEKDEVDEKIHDLVDLDDIHSSEGLSAEHNMILAEHFFLASYQSSNSELISLEELKQTPLSNASEKYLRAFIHVLAAYDTAKTQKPKNIEHIQYAMSFIKGHYFHLLPEFNFSETDLEEIDSKAQDVFQDDLNKLKTILAEPLAKIVTTQPPRELSKESKYSVQRTLQIANFFRNRKVALLEKAKSSNFVYRFFVYLYVKVWTRINRDRIQQEVKAIAKDAFLPSQRVKKYLKEQEIKASSPRSSAIVADTQLEGVGEHHPERFQSSSAEGSLRSNASTSSLGSLVNSDDAHMDENLVSQSSNNSSTGENLKQEDHPLSSGQTTNDDNLHSTNESANHTKTVQNLSNVNSSQVPAGASTNDANFGRLFNHTNLVQSPTSNSLQNPLIDATKPDSQSQTDHSSTLHN